MKKFENVMLASDIDGTFLWEGGYIHPRNIEMVRYFCENGGHFAFSSGRNYKDVYRLIPGLRELVNMPCILCNGSFLYDVETETILNPSYIDPCVTDLFQKVRDKFPNVRMRVCDTAGAEIDISPTEKDDRMLDLDAEKIFKGVFVSDEATLAHIAAFIEETYPNTFSLTKPKDILMDMQPLGIAKNSQFAYLHGLYPNAKLWCVGDYNNDLEMLRAADVAACPANASDEVKAISSVHLCHCKDGAIAELIEKIEETL